MASALDASFRSLKLRPYDNNQKTKKPAVFGKFIAEKIRYRRADQKQRQPAVQTGHPHRQVRSSYTERRTLGIGGHFGAWVDARLNGEEPPDYDEYLDTFGRGSMSVYSPSWLLLTYSFMETSSKREIICLCSKKDLRIINLSVLLRRSCFVYEIELSILLRKPGFCIYK